MNIDFKYVSVRCKMSTFIIAKSFKLLKITTIRSVFSFSSQFLEERKFRLNAILETLKMTFNFILGKNWDELSPMIALTFPEFPSQILRHSRGYRYLYMLRCFLKKSVSFAWKEQLFNMSFYCPNKVPREYHCHRFTFNHYSLFCYLLLNFMFVIRLLQI